MATPPPVIIVGSGLAGLSAASTLISRNIPVTMLDRSPKPGGNSIKASSGINGAGTRFQANDDSPDIFFQDTLKSAGDALTQASGNERARREKLISTLVQRSADAVDWLVDEKGVELSRVVQLGGHSYPRTHRGAGRGPPGVSIVGALLEGLKGGELFTLRCGARVTRVVKERECVRGVEYVTVDGGDERQGKAKTQTETHTLNGPVIFATGGFAGDSRGMLATYRPDLVNLPSTNEAREGTQPILEAVGASVVDMDCVQVHPTGLVDSKDPAALVKILAAEMLRSEGGILLDSDGSRFVNELDTRQHVVDAIVKSTCRMETSTCQWDVMLVLDESAAAAAGSHMDFYVAKGLMQKMTVDELGLAALKTLQEYADVVSGRKKDPFGRKSFGHWKLTEVMPEYEVYAGRVTPVIHFTMGGVVIDEQSMVLGAKGAPIEGLWAAGEVTGGIHGQNRLGGSSLLECVVFGRIAGNEAAAWHKEYHSGSPFP